MSKELDPLDLTGNKIIHVGDGSSNDDAATWGQVKNFINGKDLKESAVVAVNANVNIASPGASLNGVTLSTLDRVILLAQTTPSQNGVWQWNGAASALTRPADWVTGEVSQGATIVAIGGTNPSPGQWSLITPGTITVDTTAVTFTETGAPGATYTNGYGLTLSGGVFAIDTTKIVSKFAANVGNGVLTTIVVNHNLGTTDVEVQFQNATTHEGNIRVDWTATDANNVTLTFAVAPTTGQYRVVIFG